MRFTDHRVQALLPAILVFRLLPHGFSNRGLRENLAPLLGRDPSTITSEHVSYDLRRLRLHGLIERVPGTHRYQITPAEQRHALFLPHPRSQPRTTHRHRRTHRLPQHPPPLRRAANAYDTTINELIHHTGLTA